MKTNLNFHTKNDSNGDRLFAISMAIYHEFIEYR